MKLVQPTPLVFWLDHSRLVGRKDLAYYHPRYLELEDRLRRARALSLSEVAEVSKETTDPTAKPDCAFTYVDIGSVDVVTGDISPTMLLGKEAPSRARRVARPGDILVSTVRPNRNAVALIPKEVGQVVASTGFAVIRALDIDPRFLFCYLKTDLAIQQFVRRTTASMYPAISQEDVEQLHVVVPPEETQRTIVDLVSAAHRNWQVRHQAARELLGSIDNIVGEGLSIEAPEVRRQTAFWVNSSALHDRRDSAFYRPKYRALAESLEGGPYKAKHLGGFLADAKYGASLKAHEQGDVPLLRIQNLRPNEVDLTELVYVSTEEAEGLSPSQFLKQGDLLISRSGSVGIAAVIPARAHGFAFRSYMIRLTLSPNSPEPHYLSAFLNSMFGRLQTERWTSGAVQRNITIYALKLIKIPVPPSRVQERIAHRVSDMHSTGRLYLQDARDVLADALHQAESLLLATR